MRPIRDIRDLVNQIRQPRTDDEKAIASAIADDIGRMTGALKDAGPCRAQWRPWSLWETPDRWKTATIAAVVTDDIDREQFGEIMEALDELPLVLQRMIQSLLLGGKSELLSKPGEFLDAIRAAAEGATLAGLGSEGDGR